MWVKKGQEYKIRAKKRTNNLMPQAWQTNSCFKYSFLPRFTHLFIWRQTAGKREETERKWGSAIIWFIAQTAVTPRLHLVQIRIKSLEFHQCLTHECQEFKHAELDQKQLSWVLNQNLYQSVASKPEVSPGEPQHWLPFLMLYPIYSDNYMR